MFFSKENSNKNYSVIIIPEKGSRTKAFKVSSRSLQVYMVVLSVLLVMMIIFMLYFIQLKHSSSELHIKEQYIRTLEQINRVNMNKINEYDKNHNIINNKLKEIQKLEDQINRKLKKSTSLKNQSFSNSRHNNSIKYKGNLVKEMENKIIILSKLNKEVGAKLDADVNAESSANTNTETDAIVNSTANANRNADAEQFMPSKLPCIGQITSYFGYRKDPFHKYKGDYHEGIDIACAYGTKIYASASGTVEYASYALGYGKEVLIDHHNGIETIYGHSSKILVNVGQTVKKGDLIALSGSTGSSTGPHLHFEIRKNNKAINPFAVTKKGGEKIGF